MTHRAFDETDITWRILPPIHYDYHYERNQSRSSVLDSFDFAAEGFSDLIRASVFHTSSEVDFVASCQCEHLRGNSLIGMTCPECGTKVEVRWDTDNDHLRFKNWVSCPEGLPNGWLNPRVYVMLHKWLGHKKIGESSSYLDDILDITTPIPFEISEVVKEKGFGYLFANFDRIMSFFLNEFRPTSKKPSTEYVRAYLKMYTDVIWCHYIPLAPDVLHPILSKEGSEATKRRYSDTRADCVLRAIAGLSRLRHNKKKNDYRKDVEKTAFRAYKELITYRDEITDVVADGKKALPRSHMVGARLHWTYRTVITPINGPHNPDELHVPWKLLVNTLRVHIEGILGREYGLTINQIATKHTNALLKYDEDIHKIILRLIEESPFPGLPTLWHRPPTIREGSIMELFITKVKTDLTDDTISTAPIIGKPSNQDYDGDNMIGTLLIEVDMANAFMSLHPSSLIMSRNTPAVTDQIGIHKELSITWNSYLGMV